MKSTICWKCIKAYGGCKWSDNLKPVKGWNVKKTSTSYIVLSCPEFKPDLRFYSYKRLTYKEISSLLGVPISSFLNLKLNTVLNMIKVKNLPIVLNNGEFYKKNLKEIKDGQV